MATVAAGIRVRGVVFDLAGTVVDYGSIAPVVAFVKLFASARINISVETARRPMGSNKRDHIAAIAREMAGEWTAKYGAAASEANIDELYRAFTPLQLAAVKERAKPIPGAVATFETLRRRWGCRIGGCTGYHAPIVEALVPAMAANGLRFDAVEWCVAPAIGAATSRCHSTPLLAPPLVTQRKCCRHQRAAQAVAEHTGGGGDGRLPPYQPGESG